MAVAVLPDNGGRLSPLPSRRRRRLAEHLQTLVEGLERRAAEGFRHWKAAPTEVGPTRADQILGQACATCRGHCCRTGGDVAFLDTSDLERFWSTRPRASSASIVRSYLSALPERSYAGSCVFHGRSGCTLPREMRANLCNAFLCDGLRELRSKLAPDAPHGAFLATAKEGELLRAVRVDADGTTKRARRGGA